MDFYSLYTHWKNQDIDGFLMKVTADDVRRALAGRKLSEYDYLRLLSPAAEVFLESMAQKAHELTVNQFGKAILLYTPMYLSNYCVNHCLYCGFNAKNQIERKQLDLDEVEAEARRISETGLKHILILTGESRKHAGMDYLKRCIGVLKRYFTSIAIEIYPLEAHEYQDLMRAGVDSVTLYQETYDEDIYDRLHVKGPKKDYRFRIHAPERACGAGMRGMNIGALLGLSEPAKESFFTGLHAWYLQKHYPEVDISVSFPRMRPHTGSFQPDHPVDDKRLVQAILALRLFLPRAGITLSTRENARFRNHILPLGVTRMSAGSTTKVGGHTQKCNKTGQFDISDERSVSEMAHHLVALGYQPVFKDWESNF